MATIVWVPDEIQKRGDDGHIITWPDMAIGDVGLPLEMTGSSKRSIQVSGTFSAGAVGVIEGSNNGATYDLLRDITGNNLRFKASGIAQIGVLPRYLRPRIDGGDGGTSLTFSMLVRKETR